MHKIIGMDVSGRPLVDQTPKNNEKPICDSDNTKSTTRYAKIDGSIKLKREDLIIDEDTNLNQEIIEETIS